jgi:hypothetical protein
MQIVVWNFARFSGRFEHMAVLRANLAPRPVFAAENVLAIFGESVRLAET